jgi:hypothetical protein
VKFRLSALVDCDDRSNWTVSGSGLALTLVLGNGNVTLPSPSLEKESSDTEIDRSRSPLMSGLEMLLLVYDMIFALIVQNVPTVRFNCIV